MPLDNYYTITEISEKLNIPEDDIDELCREYDIFLRRISENSQIKFHSSSIDMFRFIIAKSKKGLNKKEIEKSLGFDHSYLCFKDEELCQ